VAEAIASASGSAAAIEPAILDRLEASGVPDPRKQHHLLAQSSEQEGVSRQDGHRRGAVGWDAWRPERERSENSILCQRRPDPPKAHD